MNTLSPILAETDAIGKVVVGIVVLLIWGVGALANLAKKQGQQSRSSRENMERAMRQQLEAAQRREAALAREAQGARRGAGGRGAGGSGAGAMPLPPPALQPQQFQQYPQAQRRGPAVPPMRTAQAARQKPVQRASTSMTRTPLAMMPPPGRSQPKPMPQKKAQRRRPPAMPPAPSLRSAPMAALAEETPAVAQSEIGQGTIAASPSRRAAHDGRAMVSVSQLTPRILRQQIILGEILQPPVALRKPE